MTDRKVLSACPPYCFGTSPIPVASQGDLTVPVRTDEPGNRRRVRGFRARSSPPTVAFLRCRLPERGPRMAVLPYCRRRHVNSFRYHDGGHAERRAADFLGNVAFAVWLRAAPMKAVAGREAGDGEVVSGPRGAVWIPGGTTVWLIQSNSRGVGGCCRYRTVNRSPRAKPSSIPEARSGHPWTASRPLLEMVRRAGQA